MFRFAFIMLAIAVLGLGQIPAPEKLSAEDEKKFAAEVARIEKLLLTAADKCTVEYALARTWAAGGQYDKAMEVLERVILRNAGIDPTGDRFLKKVSDSREFQSLLKRVEQATPAVNKSKPAFTIAEADLNPEGMTFDPRANRFLFGSMTKSKIVQCTSKGACKPFAFAGQDGLAEVLGIAVSPADGSVWAASNSRDIATLFHFDSAGKLIAKHSLNRKPDPHLFNDVVVDADGNAYATDSPGRSVYWVSIKTGKLEPLIPGIRITAANGIAVSGGAAPKLFVSGFPDGVTVIDLATRTHRGIGIPDGLCLATIDGLYFRSGSLIALQNGAMVPRIVQMRLNSSLHSIVSFDVLERRHPQFDNPTTGAIVKGEFYYMVNPQVDKTNATYVPIHVLRVRMN